MELLQCTQMDQGLS